MVTIAEKAIAREIRLLREHKMNYLKLREDEKLLGDRMNEKIV